MAEPGWMNDPSDPALARWYDGAQWTEHTLVKADWHGPGAPPPPATVEQVPAFAPPPLPPPPVHRPELPTTVGLPPPLTPQSRATAVSPGARAADRYKSWPLWGRIAAPAAVVLLIAGAIGSSGDDKDKVSTEDASTISFDEAVDQATDALGPDISSSAVQSLIQSLCATDIDAAAGAAVRALADPSATTDVVVASTEAAGQHCPEAIPDEAALASEVGAAVRALRRSTVTTTTVLEPTQLVTTLPAGPTTTVKPTPPPTTTRATSPPATAPPATSPPVTSPPPTSPPVTQPTPGGCTPGYSPCLQSGIGDWDCSGGSGDGPNYTGPVSVSGSDPYDLDRDGDGVGCQNS